MFKADEGLTRKRIKYSSWKIIICGSPAKESCNLIKKITAHFSVNKLHYCTRLDSVSRKIERCLSKEIAIANQQKLIILNRRMDRDLSKKILGRHKSSMIY